MASDCPSRWFSTAPVAQPWPWTLLHPGLAVNGRHNHLEYNLPSQPCVPGKPECAYFSTMSELLPETPGVGRVPKSLGRPLPWLWILLAGLCFVLPTNCSRDYTCNHKEEWSCLSVSVTVDLHCQCKRFKSGLRDKPFRACSSVLQGIPRERWEDRPWLWVALSYGGES